MLRPINTDAPYIPDVRVRPKKGVGIPKPGEYVVDEVVLTREGWFVLLEGLHIGNGGRLPADNFEVTGWR